MVSIFRPNGSELQRHITMRCAGAEVPGRHIMTTDYKVYGPSSRIGYDTQFNDMRLKIILSEDLREKEYFESWMDKIVGSYRNNISQNMYEIGYYDEYVGTATITNFTTTEEKSEETRLFECFPITLGEIQLDWSFNDIAYLPVSLAYRYYTKEQRAVENSKGGPPPNPNLNPRTPPTPNLNPRR